MPSVSKRDKEQSIIRNLDWFTLFIFVVLVAMGWMSVCGASYDFDQGGQLLDFSSRSGMQMVWILTSLILGSVILCVDDRLVESLSYIIYIAFIALLFVTPRLTLWMLRLTRLPLLRRALSHSWSTTMLTVH